MSFALFLVYLILTFLRPGEHIPQLRAWAVMDIASGLALAAAGLAVVMGRGPSFRSVQIALLLAFWTWALLGVVASPVRSDSALESVLGFGKSSCTAFLLVVLNVVTARRLRIVAVTLSVLALFVGLQAAVGYQAGFGASPAIEGDLGPRGSGSGWDDVEPEDQARPQGTGSVVRVRGVGLFGDPNDLAITLLAILPLSLALRRARAPFHNMLLVWTPIVLITYCIYLTRSRGGVLALACVLMLSVRHRIGNVLSVLAGAAALMAFLALGFLGGRSMEIDQSAMGRIWAWSGGLQMLKSSPVWGVGFDMFTHYHPRAAHSSFVQCFAELGFVGYLLWLGLILLTLDDMRCVGGGEGQGATGLQQWARALSYSLMGSLVGGLFLSRAYDVMLFVQLGLGTAVADLARRQGYLSRTRSPVWWTWLTVALAITSIIAVWLYMRLLR